jgi:hypothetical protein
LARQAKAYLFYAAVWRKRCAITLSELPVVVIDKTGGYKFIVIKVSESEVSKFVVRADAGCGYHDDIFQKFRREAQGLSARCIGGGRINIDPANKVIKIWDSSGAFGVEPDRAETVKILSETFPDFKIEASTPDW